MPKVTVLMAVYNGERYLQEAIESILNQTFLDFEFLIVNDGSIDSTREIILSYNDPRIRLVNNDNNLGLTRSLNKGLQLAKGELIARQDADDISEPERLAKQVAFLERHREVVLVGTWYKEIDAYGKLIGDRQLPCDYIQIRWGLLFYCPFVHSAVMLRKSTVLEHIGFYDESLVYAQDYELWCRIARHLVVANLDEYLLKLRINPWSMTQTYGEKTLEGYQISVATVTHLLGWDKTKIDLNEVRFDRMTTLLFSFGSHGDLNSQNFNSVIEEILQLYTAFCQFYKIDRRDCQIHRAKLCHHISNQLIQLAHYYFHQDRYFAWQLVVKVYRLHWPMMLEKRYARLLLKLLMGDRFGKMIKYIRNWQTSKLSKSSTVK
ncbi:hypothetical protein NUACC21_82450 [Scytonema sp. NUACC21]